MLLSIQVGLAVDNQAQPIHISLCFSLHCCPNTRVLSPGASGGAVIGLDGCLVGLVTSNARHSKTDRLLPKLNFSLPAEALQPLWHLLLSPAPVSTADLEKLDVNTDVLASMWALSSQPSGERGVPGGASHLQKLLQEKGIMDTDHNNLGADAIRSRL